MKRVLKIVFLIATLAIPVIIFTFLKMYGENKFSIPIYYQEGVPVQFDECAFNNLPFTVSLDQNNDKKANVTVFFEEKETFRFAGLLNISRRLGSVFPEDLTFNGYSSSTGEMADLVSLDRAEFKKLMHCNFITDTVNQFILHDDKGRIRGYYDTDLEEIDRLIVEIKILLENE